MWVLWRNITTFKKLPIIEPKIKAKIDLIVPVFVESLLKAEDITCSLESKCFGLYKKRTFWRNFTLAEN